MEKRKYHYDVDNEKSFDEISESDLESTVCYIQNIPYKFERL